MAGESGSASSSVETSLSSTSEVESDIYKVIEGLREMRYDGNLTQDQKDTLRHFVGILEVHSCAVRPQTEDTSGWEPNVGNLPQATSTPQRTESNDSGYLSAQESKQLLDAAAKPLEDIEEEIQQYPPPSKEDDFVTNVEFEEVENGGEEDEGQSDQIAYIVHEAPKSHEETTIGTEGQKVEMVTGSSPTRRQKSAGTLSQATQASSAEGSLMVQGLGAHGSTRHLNIPPAARLDLVKITSEEEVRKIEEGSLQTTVNAIYKHHCCKEQKTAEITNSPSDDPSEYLLIVDGFISAVLVTEAAAKVRCMGDPYKVDDEAQEHCEWYLKQLEESEKIAAHIIKELASTIIGIRHSLSHGNAQYSYQLQDPTTGAPMFILYKRQLKAKKYDKVCWYTAEKFTYLCTTMRNAFLSWGPIRKYLPSEAVQQAPQIRELQSAVMGSREGVMPEAGGGEETEAVEAVEE